MAYPNSDGINQAAQALQADPLNIYAFGADKQRVPYNSSDLNAFNSQVQGVLNGTPTTGYGNLRDVLTPDMAYAYIEANGGIPGDWGVLGNWLIQQGFLGYDSNWQGTGQKWYPVQRFPVAGQNYPPHGGVVDPPGTTYNVTPISSGQGTVGTAPSGNGETTTGTAPTPVGQGFSGMFSNVGQWVSQHPLEIAGGFAAYLVATGKIRLDRLL